jgi:hypothetical protein
MLNLLAKISLVAEIFCFYGMVLGFCFIAIQVLMALVAGDFS